MQKDPKRCKIAPLKLSPAGHIIKAYSYLEVSIMSQDPRCHSCGSEHIYFDSTLWICPECNHETSSLTPAEASPTEGPTDQPIRDAFGTVLQDGDSVTVIKDLKVKGAANSLKVGTKVKNIKLIEGADGHNIACRIEGFGAMNLKSEFVKKS
jgi:protein PhnA